MLGEELSDPFGVEDGGTMRGMGLLPMHTVFTEAKTMNPGERAVFAGKRRSGRTLRHCIFRV